MKRIIIVGATSGIGQETARCFIKKGWRLGIAGRREEQLQKLQKEAPEQIEYEVMDITQTDSTDQLNRLIQKTGGMDIFFLCSGIGYQNRELTAEIELNTIRTNTEGFARMLIAAFHYFKKQGKGHIAAITSIAGTKGLGSAPAYSATKRFQNCYIDCLTQLTHIKKLNIKFTDIRPGFVDTDLLKDGTYPLLMQVKPVAKSIAKAIEKEKRRIVIDYRYRILVFFWKLIPQGIWEHLPIK